MSPPPKRTLGSRVLNSPWISAGVAAACMVGILADAPAPTVTDGAQARSGVGGEDSALLGGLREGDRVAGWTVLGVSRPRDGVLRIDFGRDTVRFAIDVSPLGSQPERPPTQTDRYAIYYGHAHPEGTRIPDGAIRAITAEIARRVHANE